MYPRVPSIPSAAVPQGTDNSYNGSVAGHTNETEFKPNAVPLNIVDAPLA